LPIISSIIKSVIRPGHKISDMYRPEIDGLRAVAVIAVLLFHLHATWLPGGFLGVDVFFVISGYLISQIILDGIETHSFSIAGFYERRARRILPALLVVLIFTSVAAFLILNNYDYHLYSRSLYYVSTFISNFFFWKETTGYFGADAHDMPLLHTWSLSVEEQFYLIYPLLLAGLRKFMTSRSLKIILLFLFAASLITNCIIGIRDGNAAFYNSFARFWELLAGGLLAAGLFPLLKKHGALLSISIAGIILIVGSFILVGTIAYNFIFSITSVTGAMCVLYVSQQTGNIISSILGSRPFVFIGKISYSLYLWHWPIIVFVSLLSLHKLSVVERSVIGVVALVLSFLSYRFIEQPFRKKQGVIKNRKALLTAAVVVLLVIGLAGAAMFRYKGLANRSAADKLYEEAQIDPFWLRMLKYNNTIKADSTISPAEQIGHLNSDAKFIIWGDSHAQALAAGIDSVNRATGNFSGYVCAYPGVPPLLGATFKVQENNLLRINNRIFDFIKQHSEIKTVVIDARWLTYFYRRKSDFRVEDEQIVQYEKMDPDHADGLASKKLFKATMRFTIDELSKLNKKIIIVAAIPEVPFTFNSLMIHARFYNSNLNDYAAGVKEFENHSRELNTFFNSFEGKNVQVFYPDQYLKKDNLFLVEKNGRLLYRDGNHLSLYGSFEVAKELQVLLGK
jgi:peptidoglycan/LPS O-acetylase OafA/YrhL